MCVFAHTQLINISLKKEYPVLIPHMDTLKYRVLLTLSFLICIYMNYRTFEGLSTIVNALRCNDLSILFFLNEKISNPFFCLCV